MKLRAVIIFLILSMLVTLAGCGGTSKEAPKNTSSTAATAPPLKFPVSKPVAINIIDVAGNVQLSQAAIDKFKATYKDVITDVTITKLTAPELAAKLKAQQDSKNISTTLVFTGFDGISACIEQNLLEKLWPTYQTQFSNLPGDYLPGAKKSFDIAEGYGIVTVFCPGGPMFTYNPAAVKTPIKTPQDLLQWAKEHPKKFFYARPANSGPGRAFLMGLPYLLGDSDPKNPETWDKTWAYLKELDQYIEYYPTGTAITFKELGEGSRDMVASHLGWDMNQRILGTIPSNYQGFFLDNTTWVNDSQFATIPKGLSDDSRNAALSLIYWLLTPEMQAITYDSGYFYPGPAIKGVPIDMAPADSKAKVSAAMRPEYEAAINKFPNTTQLSPTQAVKAYDMWDKMVGSKIK